MYVCSLTIPDTHTIVPVTIETLGPICSTGLKFRTDIRHRLASVSAVIFQLPKTTTKTKIKAIR